MSESDPATAPRPGIEQRRSPRHAVPPNGTISVVGATLVNISAHGVLIESLVAMEGGAELPLRLVIKGVKVDAQSRVVQCVPFQGEKRRVYRIGLEFVSPPPGIKEGLAEILKAAAAAPPAGPA